MKKFIYTISILFSFLALSACGQKTPLEVEQPPLETPTTQEKELAPVK